MADNVTLPGAGEPIAADELAGGVKVQRAKVGWGPDGTLHDADVASGKPLPVQLRGSDGADYSAGLPGFADQIEVDITRPGDTTAYAANDAIANSTSAPTSGGFTLANAARVSGGCGIITDILVISSNDPATLLQGEVWIFDEAVTAINDNVAFSLSDADAKKLIAVVPFFMQSTGAGSGANSYAHIQNLSIGYKCQGTANLRFLLKTKNAYTPANAEVFTVVAKVLQTN